MSRIDQMEESCIEIIASMTGTWSEYGSEGGTRGHIRDRISKIRPLNSGGMPVQSIVHCLGVHREQNVISYHLYVSSFV